MAVYFGGRGEGEGGARGPPAGRGWAQALARAQVAAGQARGRVEGAARGREWALCPALGAVAAAWGPRAEATAAPAQRRMFPGAGGQHLCRGRGRCGRSHGSGPQPLPAPQPKAGLEGPPNWVLGDSSMCSEFPSLAEPTPLRTEAEAFLQGLRGCCGGWQGRGLP